MITARQMLDELIRQDGEGADLNLPLVVDDGESFTYVNAVLSDVRIRLIVRPLIMSHDPAKCAARNCTCVYCSTGACDDCRVNEVAPA